MFPEIFAYWLQAGRIDVGFLSAAQIDRFGNLNSTVIGPYDTPQVRLPGAGGAPEIAAAAGQVLVMLRQKKRMFVETVDFVTSVGFGKDGTGRSPTGGAGPRPTVITDLGIFGPDPTTSELTLTAVHPGVEVDQVRSLETGWELRRLRRGGHRTTNQRRADRAPRAQTADRGGSPTMNSFVYDVPGGRVVFGAGSVAEVPNEMRVIGVRTVMIIASGTSRHIADFVSDQLGDRFVARIDRVNPHVPIEDVEQTRNLAVTSSSQAVVTIGGGSAIGLGKNIALALPIRHVAIPTTYSGSEMTAIHGMTVDGRKQTGRDPRAKPHAVIYDPDLSRSLPMEVTAGT